MPKKNGYPGKHWAWKSNWKGDNNWKLHHGAERYPGWNWKINIDESMHKSYRTMSDAQRKHARIRYHHGIYDWRAKDALGKAKAKQHEWRLNHIRHYVN